MIDFKKILVPIDFSDPSREALRYAVPLAVQLDARLLVAHVVPDSATLAYAFPAETYQIEKQQYESAKAEIQDWIKADAAECNVQAMVKTGNIDAELLGIVRNEGVDLVVMGTHGRRRPGRWFVGSVTERMLRKVPVPLITVRRPSPDATRRRILYAADLSPAAGVGLKYAANLARGLKAALTAVHVVDLPHLVERGGLVETLERESGALLHEARLKELRDLVTAQTPPDMEVDAVVAEGKPYEKLLEIAETRGMDLIVLNTQSKGLFERTFLGSPADRVVRLSRVPVLSVPAGTGAADGIADDGIDEAQE